MEWSGGGRPVERTARARAETSDGWTWIDLSVHEGTDVHAAQEFVHDLGFDRLAVHDAFNEVDLPKVDDFGSHLLVVLHGLRTDAIETYEVDCFITHDTVVTVRHEPSPSIEALWTSMLGNEELAAGGSAEIVARLADGTTRRLLSVVDAFDRRVDELTELALSAHRELLGDVVAVRTDVARVRRVVHPQREALDILRASESPLVTDSARRRFADVFDVAVRAASGLDAARASLSETLDAYRGAEARQATEITRVLTVYAAVLLPLSLIVGFFGMNHSNLPTLERQWGWMAVVVLMVAVSTISIGVFVVEGWVRRPSGRRAGARLGRGLLEAVRAPVTVAGVVYEISSMPVRGAIGKVTRPRAGRDDDDD